MKSVNTYRRWKLPLPPSSYLMLTTLKHFTKGSTIIPMNVWKTEKISDFQFSAMVKKRTWVLCSSSLHWVFSPVCHRTTLLFLVVSMGVESSLCKKESSYDVKTRVWLNGEYECFMCVCVPVRMYVCVHVHVVFPKDTSSVCPLWASLQPYDCISAVLKPSTCPAWAQSIAAWAWHGAGMLPWFPVVWCANLASVWSIPQRHTVSISLHATRQY